MAMHRSNLSAEICCKQAKESREWYRIRIYIYICTIAEMIIWARGTSRLTARDDCDSVVEIIMKTHMKCGAKRWRRHAYPNKMLGLSVVTDANYHFVVGFVCPDSILLSRLTATKAKEHANLGFTGVASVHQHTHAHISAFMCSLSLSLPESRVESNYAL